MNIVIILMTVTGNSIWDNFLRESAVAGSRYNYLLNPS